MYRRNATDAIKAALLDSPVVLIHGARQVGKTTLVRDLLPDRHAAQYLTLDKAVVLAAAQADPEGFLGGFDGPIVIDEVQRAPQLFRAIKASVDEDRRPGRFLLTGSANVLALPDLSESLAGRMEVTRLRPLSQGETEDVREDFIDRLFATKFGLPERSGVDRRSILRRIERGGFPEVQTRKTAERRDAWFESYLTTILQRDVRDLSNIEDLTALPRLLRLLAARIGGLLNYSDLSRALGLPQTTLKRYFALLETTFLVHLVPPWSANLGARLVKSPKVYLLDTGLACHLLGAEGLADDHPSVGGLLENFVLMELLKQATWNTTRAEILHFRTQLGREVDLVLEDRRGRLVGIEIKASATVGADDFRGLRALADLASSRFHRGVVLYTGSESVAFGKEMYALPISSLWTRR